MWLLLAGFVLLVCAAGAAPVADAKSVPDFGKMYHFKGELSLPHSEIKETFEVWLDLEGSRGRIDFRNGTMQTFMIGDDLDHGAIYQIIQVLQVIKCFQLKGTKENPIVPRVAFPDPRGFGFEKMENHTGVLCEVWKSVTEAGHEKKTYRLWITRPEGNDSPATPHRFEMEVHNGKFTIDYTDFSHQTESDIFTLPLGMTCEELPASMVEKSQIMDNPILKLFST